MSTFFRIDVYWLHSRRKVAYKIPKSTILHVFLTRNAPLSREKNPENYTYAFLEYASPDSTQLCVSRRISSHWIACPTCVLPSWDASARVECGRDDKHVMDDPVLAATTVATDVRERGRPATTDFTTINTNK